MEYYLTSFINTCKKCKFEIPNYNLLRPVYTDGTDVSNKLEIDTSKLILRETPNEKYAPKPSPVIDMPPTTPAKPTETQAVIVTTPSNEILPEPKEMEPDVPALSEKAVHLLEEGDVETPEVVVDNIDDVVTEPVVECEQNNQDQQEEKSIDLSLFTTEETDLISMIKEGWHAADIMKYFGIRSKNVLKVRLCDLAIRGIDISNVDWNPSNKFSTKVQKNGSIILSASKLHNCNFILNPGDEVQILCKDGNLILTHNK